MKITNKNFNEMINHIADARTCAEYNRECFSKSEVELYTIVVTEFDKVCNELAEAGVNFDKFVIPVMDAFEIELNEDKLSEVRLTNNSEHLPENLNIEIDCPYIDGVDDWYYNGHVGKNKCRVTVTD